MKEILDILHVTGRGIIIVLKNYDTDAKVGSKIWLYDSNRNLVGNAEIRGIESQGNRKMAFNIRGSIQSMVGLKYYTL